MSATFREAVELAAWYTRYAIDRAPGEPDLHPGVVSHLTAARAQHDAAEQLLHEHTRAAA